MKKTFKIKNTLKQIMQNHVSFQLFRTIET